MRLKSLEIKGFKSFANETVLHFDEDVIGVVGPNGSGKSNIVDAIRWVLGEQKGKELRLEKMGDVIFNGTKKRKAGAMAQVTLTFDNTKNLLPTEYNQVAVSRVLYRSGESEYKLNGVTCRLKDITSLLIDTGIGSNSYAIIALGMVDDILQDKENARRKMFEQAAGVSKYKKRKHETMLKLKSTTADLDRIEDLLFEIRNNLKALEKQARRTQRFVDLKGKYKDQSIQLAIKKVGHIKEDYAQLEKQIETEKNIYRQLEADLAKKEASLAELKKVNLDDEQNVSGFQRELNILVGTIRTMENEKSLLQQKVIFIDQTKKRLEAQVTANEVRLKQLDAEIKELEGRRSNSRKSLEDYSGALDATKEQQTKVQSAYQAAKSNKDNLTESQMILEKEIHQLEKDIAILQTNLQNMDHTSTFDQNQLDAIQHAIKAGEKGLKGVEKERAQLEKQLAGLESNEKKRIERLHHLNGQLNDTKEELIKVNRSLDAKKHEHDLLKDMVARLEGFPESIKFLSKSKSWQVEAPLLSDIIYCDPKYRSFVEHLLEPYLNHFVVQDLESAADAINLLHASQKGKANFFILDQLRPNKQRGKLAKVGGATPLMEFIETDDTYGLLIDQLLGNVYLTDDHPTDPRYHSKDFEDLVLLDSNGKMIRKAYSLSGGSIGLFEGKKLGRKKNLEHLAKEIKTLDKKQVKLISRIQEFEGKKAKLEDEHEDVALAELRNQVADVDQRLIEMRSRLSHQVNRQSEIHDKIEAIKMQREKLKGELENKKAEHKSKFEVVMNSSEELDNADADFHQHVEDLSVANAKMNEAQVAFMQHQNAVETLERELEYKNRQIAEIADLNARHQKQLEDDMVELGQIEVALENLENELHQHYSDKKSKESNLSQIEQQFYQARNQIQELEEKVKKIAKEQQNSQYLINQLKEEYTNLKFTITSVSERLHIEFAVRLEDVIGEAVTDELPVDDLQVKVDKMKYRLENFGEINPMAIEAYEEMKSRHDRIDEQRIDILNAKESLLQTIDEIEKTATEKFEGAFEKIRKNFIEVFRSLFTEDDNCDLILEDPEKPLESRIRIIAKPKGKRPKSLSQLSGGEKTLTATALLFALYLLKPAPFCIFDEVDAPLDDANILKFNKIIKKFSKDSQFIIVTHNKSTMAEVDVIYGVYMEEMGVSALSAVDFRSFEHQDLQEVLN